MSNRRYALLVPLLTALLAPAAYATEYYALPTGSGMECSLKNPCKIASFWAKAQPGDILNLQNGTYTGNDSMINPPADYDSANGGTCRSLFGGREGKPLTVRAINDGKAIIDGQWARQPGRLLCSQYIVLEGMRFQNSSRDVVEINRSTRNVLKRVSAYNANFHLAPNQLLCPNTKYDNYHVLNIIYRSTYNVVEDSILGGSGRNLVDSFKESNFNIFRRSILVGGGYVRENQIPGCNTPASSQHGEAAQLYGVSDNVMENIIAFGIGDWQGRLHPLQSGVNIWANTNEEAHRNKYYGTLVMDYPGYGFYHASRCNGETDSDMCVTDTLYENVVSFRNGVNIWARNGRNYVIRNSSFLQAGVGNSSSNTFKAGLYMDGSYDADQSSSWSYENVLVAGNKGYGCYGLSTLSPQGVRFNYGLFFGNQGDFFSTCARTIQNSITQGANPQLTSLVYVDPSSPAYSAGRSGGQVGADMRCRYVSRFENGGIATERTSQSLWPLPNFINERVKTETLEIHGTAYDVNAKVLDALGPRDNSKLSCLGETPTPPTRPTGLAVR